MEVAAGAAYSCRRAPSNYSTTDAAEAKELNLKYDGFRSDGGGAEESEWEGPTRVTGVDAVGCIIRIFDQRLVYAHKSSLSTKKKITKCVVDEAWRRRPGTEEIMGPHEVQDIGIRPPTQNLTPPSLRASLFDALFQW